MKKQSILLIILIPLLSLLYCSNPSSKSIESSVLSVDLENCKTSIDLRLSDLMDDIKLVPLETTNECLLGQYIFNLHIGNKYIIIDDGKGVYKFSSDGRFIRKIINVGRGPQEVSGSLNCVINEKKNLLYFDDRSKINGFLYVYNIESEKFLNPIKKCFPDLWGDFAIYQDSLIIASIQPPIWGSMDHIISMDSLAYGIFFQNFDGDFISGLNSKRKYIPFRDQTEVLQRMSIYTGDQSIHVKYILDDTLFTLKNNQLYPYIIPFYKSKKTKPPRMLPLEGDKRITYEKFENSSFIVLRNSTYTGMSAGRAYYRNVYYLLNKSNGKYGIIKSYTDDLTGKIQGDKDEKMILPSTLPDEKIYVLYYPHELLQNQSNDNVNQYLQKKIKDQFFQIKSNLNETDNPVLLIGTPKKRIQIL